ncbi:MAG: hypothetical protein NWQ31_08070 [Polaribacter sp.]|nr:hypothetical protein [Polaribacter sp.]
MKKGKVLNLFEGKNTGKNTEEKYAILLDKFILPFEDDFNGFEYQEEVFDVAIEAWNYGNIKSLLGSKEFKKIISFAKENDVNYPILKKLIAYKVSNFKEFTYFIVDFDIKEINNDLKLTVVTEKEETYMINMLMGGSVSDAEPQFDKDEFEQNYINRSLISLKPLQPFVDWNNTIYPDSKIDLTTFNEVNIYLIKNSNYEDIEAHLRKKFDTYFMMELEGWHTDKKEWPQRRNYKMFKEWFRIDISTAVYDLEKTPISKSE